MTGQVHQKQVRGAAVIKEILDVQPDLLGWLVNHGSNCEIANVWIGQDQRQVCGILGQAPEPGNPASAYMPVAITRACRDPAGGSVTGGMAS